MSYDTDMDVKMIERLPVTNKDAMKDLYRRQVEGTKNLYHNVGYFFRMRFWDTVNDPTMVKKIMEANSSDEHIQVYKYVLDLMNRYIDKGATSAENINNMIYNRDTIEASFAENPDGFTQSLKKCLHREKDLWVQYYGAAPELSQNDLLMELPSATEIDHIEEVQENLANMDDDDPQYLHSVCASYLNGTDDGITDEKFLNTIDDKYTDMEKHFRKKEELYKEHNTMKQKADECLSNNPSVTNQWNMILNDTTDLHRQFLRQHEAFEQSKRDLLTLLEEALENLKMHKDQFLCHQAQAEVGLMEKKEYALTTLFDRYARILYKINSSNCIVDTRLDTILENYMVIALIVLENPEGLTFIEKAKGEESEGQGKTGKGKSSKGKELKTFVTKKNSGMKATLQILGGLSDTVYPKDHSAILKSYAVSLITEEGQKAGELSYPTNCLLHQCLLEFKDIKLTEHTRQQSSNTRSQFVRLLFTLNVSFFQKDFQLQTRSLPFNLLTGSLQALEFIGTRMWYVYCNKNDMYFNCKMQDDLDTNQVMAMLDQRVQSISLDKYKKRGLSRNAKEFVLKQIPLGSKTNRGRGDRDKITEHCFTKEIIGKSGDDGVADRKFSFHTWFYAFVNTIQQYLLEPWLDGIVYDLLTKEDANQILLADNIEPYTALLRPVRSWVINPNCKGALVKIAVEVKLNEDKIEVIDINMSDYKVGLYRILRSVTRKDNTGTQIPIIKRILNSNNKCVPLTELKKYQKKMTDQPDVEGYHKSSVQSRTLFEIPSLEWDPQVQGCSPAKSGNYTHECMPRRRKSSRTVSSDGSSISSLHSPFSISYNETSPSGRNNDSWSPGVVSNGTASAFSPQQLRQLDIAEEQDLKEEPADSPTSAFGSSPAHSQSNGSSAWEDFGAQKVDVTQLKVQLPLSNGLNCDNGPVYSNGIRDPLAVNTNYLEVNGTSATTQPLNNNNTVSGMAMMARPDANIAATNPLNVLLTHINMNNEHILNTTIDPADLHVMDTMITNEDILYALTQRLSQN